MWKNNFGDGIHKIEIPEPDEGAVMDKKGLIRIAEDFVETSAENRVTKADALSEEVVGMRIFDAPIFGFGDAGDEYFSLLKDPGIIGPHFRSPEEWLPEAQTVISFFLPFTETVRGSNARERLWPSKEWLHARIEGQAMLSRLSIYLNEELVKAGYATVAPTRSAGYWDNEKPSGKNPLGFTSTWSERHVAFVCGLGTFGLSKGIITTKGMAGRFGSLVTSLRLTPDTRTYEGIYEHCSSCGACIRQCPVSAISFEHGKDHVVCSDFLDETRERFRPRYGCGKCQVNVPCESRIPAKEAGQ